MQALPETSREWWRPHAIIVDELGEPWPCVERPGTSPPDDEAQANYRELEAALAHQ